MVTTVSEPISAGEAWRQGLEFLELSLEAALKAETVARSRVLDISLRMYAEKVHDMEISLFDLYLDIPDELCPPEVVQARAAKAKSSTEAIPEVQVQVEVAKSSPESIPEVQVEIAKSSPEVIPEFQGQVAKNSPEAIPAEVQVEVAKSSPEAIPEVQVQVKVTEADLIGTAGKIKRKRKDHIKAKCNQTYKLFN